jgi:hypothetical protein
MTRLRLILAIAAANAWAFAETPASAVARAPVLQNPDAADNRVVLLPGSVPAPPLSPSASTSTPVRGAKPIPPKVEPPPAPAVSKPSSPRTAPSLFARASAPVKAPYPADFGRDSAAFLQQRIGKWTERECRALLGRPSGSRPAFGENGARAGEIYNFADVTGRYARLELEFERATGRLHTVFAYPRRMSWDDCRRLWGADTVAANAKKGRMFYSYADRRVDVLVEPSGKVVSLGLY